VGLAEVKKKLKRKVSKRGPGKLYYLPDQQEKDIHKKKSELEGGGVPDYGYRTAIPPSPQKKLES